MENTFVWMYWILFTAMMNRFPAPSGWRAD